jgi:hypothetical protein
MQYRVHAVGISGISRTDYELDCSTDEEAKRRAVSYLNIHSSVEIWQGIRRVARLTRTDPTEPTIS